MITEIRGMCDLHPGQSQRAAPLPLTFGVHPGGGAWIQSTEAGFVLQDDHSMSDGQPCAIKLDKGRKVDIVPDSGASEFVVYLPGVRHCLRLYQGQYGAADALVVTNDGEHIHRVFGPQFHKPGRMIF